MARLLFAVTVPETAYAFLRGQLGYLRRRGYEVSVVSSPGPLLDELAGREEVRTFAVPMAREISPVADLRALRAMTAVIRQVQPEIMNASTPKAGLIGMLAARYCRVPARIYQLRGLRLETTTGAKRLLLASTERLAAAGAHTVVCNSHSLREQYAALGLAPAAKLTVLGAGSSNGVIAERFLPSPQLLAEAAALRSRLALDPDSRVIGFVGRLTRDKGIVELADAFVRLAAERPDLRLLLVGAWEAGDPVPAATRAIIESHPAVRLAGFVKEPAAYYHLMQILAFPSYREGFPNVPLEAAVAGVPAVGFQATGVVDAVRHGETGLLSAVGDTAALEASLRRLLDDEILRLELGRQAHEWVMANFRPETIWRHWADFYDGLLRH